MWRARAIQGDEAGGPVASINADVRISRRPSYPAPRRRQRLWVERLERRLHLAAGDLASSFGTGGVVTGAAGTGRAVAVDAGVGGGRIYVFAELANPVGADLSITRLLPSGLPDATFSGDGRVDIDIGGDEFALDAAVTPDGKLVVLGETIDGQSRSTSFLIRFLPTGQRDGGFGKNGFAYFPPSFFANAIDVDGFSDTYIAGGIGVRGDSTAAVAKVVIDGVLDNNFGTGGIQSATAVGVGGHADVAVAGGTVVTVGGPNSVAAVHQYDASSGALDTRFGSAGATLISPFVNGGWGVERQSGGGIVVLGVATGPTAGGQLALARLQAGGFLDTTFGSGGFVNTGIPNEFSIGPRQLAVGSGGSIVVAGDPATAGPLNGLTVNRYNADGTPDAGFGVAGSAAYSASIGSFYTRGIALAPPPAGAPAGALEDVVVVGGSDPEGAGNVKVVRIQGSTTPPFAAFDPATGTLSVTGTAGGDAVLVDVQGGATLVAQLGPDQLFFPAATVATVSISTGDGRDAVTVSAAVTQGVVVELGGGNNSFVTSGSGPVTVRGGGGRDSVTGGPANDLLVGFGNADRFLGGGGNDTIDAGSGPDFIDGGAGADAIDAGDGNDSVIGGGGNDSVVGGLGDDELSGSPGNDTLDAGGGNDRVFGGDGNDLLMGGAGSDSMDGHAGLDRLSGGDGNDLLLGDDANAETLTGDAGIDIVRADAADVLVSCELRYRVIR